MKLLYLALLSFVVILISCESVKKEEPEISEEHAVLIGTWLEKDSIKNIEWIFDRFEVKWNGFSHFYKVSEDSLIISGIAYHIIEQSEKRLKLVTLNGKPSVLIRKE